MIGDLDLPEGVAVQQRAALAVSPTKLVQ